MQYIRTKIITKRWATQKKKKNVENNFRVVKSITDLNRTGWSGCVVIAQGAQTGRTNKEQYKETKSRKQFNILTSKNL